MGACMQLADGSCVGVIGGGPAGTFTSYFLLETAERVGLALDVDIYEPQNFSRPGPAGCNMCGGIVSESLVQLLATEGINLPPSVVQRGIDSYVLHTDQRQIRMATPVEEMRIAALHRGSGPKGCPPGEIESFDGFLLDLAREKGAHVHACRVNEVAWEDGRPVIRADGMPGKPYDMIVGAVGVNSTGLKLFEGLDFELHEPQTAKTLICEICLGREKVQEYLGNAMHVFLIDLPGLEFSALIPKGDYVTVCMLGVGIDQSLAERFMNSPDVRSCLPIQWDAKNVECRCLPRINVTGAKPCFADRVVLVGDCGVSRLYKDGIGAAYRTAKACAVTAIFRGVSRDAFRAHYWKTCRRLEWDNRLGKGLFLMSVFFRKLRFLRRAMLRMIESEQHAAPKHRAMSTVMWNTFTGSAPYRDIVLRSMMPDFVIPFSLECVRALLGVGNGGPASRSAQ